MPQAPFFIYASRLRPRFQCFIRQVVFHVQQVEDRATDGNKLTRELFGLFLLFCGLLLLLSLATFDPRDPSLNHVVSGTALVRNKAGLFGAYCSGLLVDFFGFAALVFPVLFLVLGGRKVLSAPEWPWWRWWGFVLLALCLCVSGAAWKLGLFNIRGGGLLGGMLCTFSHGYFSAVGTALVWGFVFLLSVQMLLGFSWLALIAQGLSGLWSSFQLAFKELREGKAVRPEERRPLVIDAGKADKADRTDKAPAPERAAKPVIKSEERLAMPGPPLSPAGASFGDDSFLLPGPDPSDPPWLKDLEEDGVRERAVRDQRSGAPVERPQEAEKAPTVAITPQVRPVPAALASPVAEVKKDHRAPLPGLDLLHAVSSAAESTPRSVLEAKGKSLMTCLTDFGIQGELVGIAPGPVVTMFEIRPAPGVKVARIAGLSDDLALALKAIAVRIQAPIPGTDTVGIEIPNEIRETVCLKELFSSQAFVGAESLLTMALGKDISGRPAVADLARMPHLLVSGATGAGKSVCLNSILLSFLYKARPEEVKLLLVDPKRIEMAVYADLPHLVHPVVTEMSMAKNALDWAVAEMDRRYTDIARLGVRNIAAYNDKLRELGPDRAPELADLAFMPYLVIIIDELADLMLTAAKEVEVSIVRLAQLARAAGIHMILATQRPSVDVVTGLIKANFPCRISFQVTSKHDSRTILDAVGAEHLLGKGDMLFKPGGGKFQRLHGAFVSDDDVGAVSDYWRARQKPNYKVDFAEMGTENGSAFEGGSGGGDIASDPMYADAVDFVCQQGKASISLIQRRFRIGFNRAARFVEQMEADGLIGPADGSTPRLVIR